MKKEETSMDCVVPVIKLKSPIRECPVHGKVKVLDRFFDKGAFSGTEGLSCGHTLLVSRRAGRLKTIRKRFLLSDPRNWTFDGWALVFKETRSG